MDDFDLRQWPDFVSAGGSLAEPTVIDQIVIDSRRIDSSHALFVALKGEKEDGHHYINQAFQSGAKFALVSDQWQSSVSYPGLTLLRVPHPLKAFQAIAKAYRSQLPTKIIGLTGSFGKTMVKDLLHALLCTQKQAAVSPESFNSQIGVTLSLLNLSRKHEIAVIEAAISHPQEMDTLCDMIQPDYTILTPFGKKHLATLQDISTLVHELFKLIQATSSTGWSLLPQEPILDTYLTNLPCPFFFWNASHPQLPHASLSQTLTPSFYQLSFPDTTCYQGKMTSGYAYFLNLINMAVKAAWLLGISSDSITTVLQTYQAEPMRTEIWKTSLGALFINDSYCSDPQSVDQVLNHFHYAKPEHRKIFVFGGMRGELSHTQTGYRRIGKALAKAHVQEVCLVGAKPFRPLMEELKKQAPEIDISSFENYTDTFAYLQQHLRNHDLVIFKGENKLPLEQLTEVFHDSVFNNQCVINLAAIQTNLALIRKQLPPHTRVMAIVKAFAYGTDDVRMAKFLTTCGVDILGVSYVDEGVVLKQAGVLQSIFSINAARYEVAKVVKWDLEVGVSDSDFISALAQEAAQQNKQIKVHLHINTGMGRFGCRPEEALTLARQIQSYSSLILEGLMTHFACADDPKEDSFTWQQITSFDQTIAELKHQGISAKWIHAANSSGALRFSLPQYNMVRVGLAVYGLYGSEATHQALDLRLALSLTSRIVGLNICKAGETISYGRRYCVARETQKIAVLPIGYFDGLHRNYSGKAFVLIRGHQAPMVGNICMDYMMVDVTDIPHVAVGDQVLIFGEDEYGYYLSPEDLATSGDSIVHELITCLGPRIQRIFVYEEAKQIR